MADNVLAQDVVQHPLNVEVPLGNPPPPNDEGARLVYFWRCLYISIAISSIFMAGIALVCTRLGQRIIGDKAELNPIDAATGKTLQGQGQVDLKLSGQRALELLVGSIVIVVIIVAGIFGQWLHALCHQVANLRMRKVC